MAYLCLRCRDAGHKAVDCNAQGSSGTSAVSAPLPSGRELCQRCRDLNIVDLLLHGDVRDELSPGHVPAGQHSDITATGQTDITSMASHNTMHNFQHYRPLGPFSQVSLLDSCPLCRLIFAVFPAEDDSVPPETEYVLRPKRTYNRLGKGGALGHIDEATKKTYSVTVSVGTKEQFLMHKARHMDSSQDAALNLSDFAFGLTSTIPTKKTQGLPVRVQDVVYDPEVVKGWIQQCEREHPDCLSEDWSDELLTTRMIDVQTRTVVDCPDRCRYIALSYVWGAVIPEDDGLRKGTLPPTIEDAILVTRSLGFRYLWVDALCIDQRPSPQKLQQLGIMDLIYSSACATIIALHGEDSNAGLRGVRPRGAQARETVDGHEMAVMFPPVALEFQSAKHTTRAWTLQELVMSRLRILFAKDQVNFHCQREFVESIDDTVDPAGILKLSMGKDSAVEFDNLSRLPTILAAEPNNVDLRHRAIDSYFDNLVSTYTARQMTNDADSLNACLGLLNLFQRVLVPDGFVWGLPLTAFPQSLRWCHMRWVMPRRRLDFPSWSFAGWAGEASYTDGLVLENEPNYRRFVDVSVDLRVEFVRADGKVLTLRGCAVTLQIRNEPFNSAYMPGTEIVVGKLQEGVVLHTNTLPEGRYEFVVVERVGFRAVEGARLRQTLYLLMLGDLEGGIPTRRAMVRLYAELDFIGTEEYKGLFKGRKDIQMV